MIQGIVTALETATERGTNIVVIGDQLLHPVKWTFAFVLRVNQIRDWIHDHLIVSFKTDILPAIVQALRSNPKLEVYMLPGISARR